MDIKSKKIQLENAIDLNLIEMDKFKSNNISIFFTRNLDESEVSMNTILPLVLKRGNKHYQSNLEIQRKLEELYGSSLGVGINKRGEKQVIKFTMEFVDDKYIEENISKEIIDFLYAVVFEPLVIEGSFKESFVEIEKENLKRRIKGKINDKRSYAIDRTLEEMCSEEPYSISALGTLESVDNIDGRSLYDHYMDFIETSKMEIFYSGRIDKETIDYLGNKFTGLTYNAMEIKREEIDIEVSEVKNIREEFNVSQGKLVMGYRAYTAYEEDLYYSLIIGNEIFGGGSSSKLFLDIREKNSLAYYIGSSVLKHKSIIILDSGIEFENYDLALKIIEEKLDEMKRGDFSEEDIEMAKKSIISSYKSIDDSNYSLIEFTFGQSLSNDFSGIEDRVKIIKDVNKESIVRAMNKIKLDTIYFMDKKE